MKTYDLDIKEVENTFVITIDKNQLDADYILNLINWLHYAAIQPEELNQYLFRVQQLAQKNQVEPKSNEKEWKFSGSVNFNNQLDNINIRDFAYE